MALGSVNEATLKEAGYTRYSVTSADQILGGVPSKAFWQRNKVDGIGTRYVITFYEFEVASDTNGKTSSKFKCEVTLRRQSDNSESFRTVLDLGSGAGVAKYEAAVEEMFVLLGCNYHEHGEHLSFRNVEPYESLVLAAAATKYHVSNALQGHNEAQTIIAKLPLDNYDIASSVSQYREVRNNYD